MALVQRLTRTCPDQGVRCSWQTTPLLTQEIPVNTHRRGAGRLSLHLSSIGWWHQQGSTEIIVINPYWQGV